MLDLTNLNYAINSNIFGYSFHNQNLITMKNFILLLVGVLIGGVVMYFYLTKEIADAEIKLTECQDSLEQKKLQLQANRDIAIHLKDLHSLDFIDLKSPIGAGRAFTYHQNYLNRPVLKTKTLTDTGYEERDIEMFFLSNSAIARLEASGNAFAFDGVALIPGLIPPGVKGVQEGHTLIAVGYEVLNEQDTMLILPSDWESTAYIEDHLYICPNVCPENIDRLSVNPVSGGQPWTLK